MSELGRHFLPQFPDPTPQAEAPVHRYSISLINSWLLLSRNIFLYPLCTVTVQVPKFQAQYTNLSSNFVFLLHIALC